MKQGILRFCSTPLTRGEDASGLRFLRPILCRIPSTEIPRDFEGGRTSVNLCSNLLNISGMLAASSYFQRDGGGETREKVFRRCFFFFLFGMKFNVECQINIFLIESWWIRIFSILNYESFFLSINYRSVFLNTIIEER